MRSGPSGAPEERGWGAATDPVALMGPLVIVGLHEPIEASLERRSTREVAPTEGHTPMLLQDRALQPLDEPIGPGMPGLRPGVAEAERPTGLIEGSVELGAAGGEHPPPPPARPADGAGGGGGRRPAAAHRGRGGRGAPGRSAPTAAASPRGDRAGARCGAGSGRP